MRKVFGTLVLAALVAVFGCSGGSSTGPSGRSPSSSSPADTSGKLAATDQGGKAASGTGTLTPENTKIDFNGAAPDHKHDGGFKKLSGRDFLTPQ